jgi:hypothetical protein
VSLKIWAFKCNILTGKGLFGDVFLAKARGIKDYEPETLVVVKSLLVKDEHLFFEFRQELDMYTKLECVQPDWGYFFMNWTKNCDQSLNIYLPSHNIL